MLRPEVNNPYSTLFLEKITVTGSGKAGPVLVVGPLDGKALRLFEALETALEN